MKQVDFEKHLLFTLQSEAKRLEKQYPQGNYICSFEDIEHLWCSDFTKEQYKSMIGAYAMMIVRANDNRVLPSETEIAKGKRSLDLFQGGNLTYRQILSILYNARRNLNYPSKLTEKECNNLDNILKKPTPQIDVRDTGKWIIRSPSNRRQKGYSTSSDPQDRLVANINFDENVIKKIDNYCSKRRCWYKTLETVEACHRVDTLVIYSLDQLSDADKKEFVGIVSPYVRHDIPHRTNTLDGTLIAEGISTAPELNSAQCKQFIDNYRCSSSEKESLIKACTDKGKLKISLGQYTILQELSSLMYKFYQEQQNSQDKQLECEKAETQKISCIGVILNALQMNDVFLSKDSKGRDLFVFVPKESVSRSDALGAVHKMKEAGMNIIAGAQDKDNKPLYTTDPNINSQKQNEWMKLLQQHISRKQ
ncbi:MAG: hypothetical protein IKV03_05545 [Alphaproteobacteria bacterium]|nr:hypothetical protein [Alphaproteobacteria bacterium]